jgi:hypothetical protein
MNFGAPTCSFPDGKRWRLSLKGFRSRLRSIRPPDTAIPWPTRACPLLKCEPLQNSDRLPLPANPGLAPEIDIVNNKGDPVLRLHLDWPFT